jgi:hypothetical protein
MHMNNDENKVSTTVLIRLPAEGREITVNNHGWGDVLGEPSRRQAEIRSDPDWQKLPDREKLIAVNEGGFAGLMGLGDDDTNTQFYNGTIHRLSARSGKMWAAWDGKMKLSHHISCDETIKGHGPRNSAWGPDASKRSDVSTCIYSSWEDAIEALPPLPLAEYRDKVLKSIDRHNEIIHINGLTSKPKQVPSNDDDLRQAIDEGPYLRGAIVAFYLESIGVVPKVPLMLLSDKCPSWEIAAFYFHSSDGSVGEFGLLGGAEAPVWLEGVQAECRHIARLDTQGTPHYAVPGSRCRRCGSRV